MVQRITPPLTLSTVSYRTAYTHSVVCVTLLLILAALETWTTMDMAVQLLIYDTSTSSWLLATIVPPELRSWLHLGLYTVPKIVLAGLGIACLCMVGLSLCTRFSMSWLRRPCIFMILCLALVPLLVAGSKQFTNIYCPKDLTVFGGERTYQRLFEPAHADNANAPRGKGFPAGHASGGFALMGLYFLTHSPRKRLAGLATGLVIGWLMGGYQMLRGEHFLSHTLTSMVAAWLVIICTTLYCNQIGKKRLCKTYIVFKLSTLTL